MTYINGGHWQEISWYPTQPPPCRTVYSPSLCCTTLPHVRDAVCGFWKAEVKNAECSTGLYPSLPAAGNQHRATSCGRGSASQHNTLQHLFCFAGWRRVGGAGGGIDKSSFYRTTPEHPENTWALWATESSRAWELHDRSSVMSVRHLWMQLVILRHLWEPFNSKVKM